MPSITRKTDKGLPRYDDAAESDEFILTGAEDLVPAFKRNENGEWLRDTEGHFIFDEELRGDHIVRRYLPRIEGSFARIERWTAKEGSETHWRSITKENITTLYGKTSESRIADPFDPGHVFSWLICQSYDDKGNAIVYSYRAEDDTRIFETRDRAPEAWAHERNREPRSTPNAPEPRSANRYPAHIRYGNRSPNRDENWRATDPATLAESDWMFEIVFDYGEDHYTERDPDATGHVFATAQAADPARSQWPARQDRFSSYRSGFEVRTYRLCRRVLLFHRFPDADELGIADCLVRATEFTFTEDPIATVMDGFTQSGYVRMPEGGQENRYLKKSLPTLELGYSQIPSPEELAQLPVDEFDAASLANLPFGVDGTAYQWIDLDGEGASGILTEQADAWFYKRNLSANNVDNTGRVLARFGPAELVRERPAASLGRGGAQFMDLAGDGHNDLVQMTGPVKGLYERTGDDGWSAFRSFTSWPNVDTSDPNLKFVDLDGDGHADMLVAEHENFRWYRSLAEEGFAAGVRTATSFDEEKGPRLVFADGTNSVYVADMSGDGLSDLVRIRNGEICYWPNLGYGRFGSRVTMDNAPWFDAPDLFDQRRVRLADTDGSGVTDVIYLARDGVRLYLNESGNSWREPATFPQFAPLDNLSTVQTVDLLGSGTTCLVWSSPLPSLALRPVRYLDLMGGTKPHLLRSISNNLGAETRIEYRPSTHFYLDDLYAGTPWLTRLAFPVQCVARVETIDWVSRNRFTTSYTYHHGYFDGEEREFRGFGRVDQLDTEIFGALDGDGTMPEVVNWEASSHVPPVETKTWFHTGIYLDRERVSQLFASEYFREPTLSDEEAVSRLLDDTPLPDHLSSEEEREACRALKGQMLRQETFARDGSGKEAIPYTVTEQNFATVPLQPRGDNRHAVFFTHPAETITYHFERNPDDPRVSHKLTLDVDRFGNVLKSAIVGYGRRQADPDLVALMAGDDQKQTTTLITYTENRFTDPPIDKDDHYRTPMICETRTYELIGYAPTGSNGRFRANDVVRHTVEGEDSSPLVQIVGGEVLYEAPPVAGVANQRRLIEHVRTLYRPNDLGFSANDPEVLLRLGKMESLALPGETYKLALTPGLMQKVYVRPLDTLQPADAPPPEPLLPKNLGEVLPIDSATGGADRGGYLSSEKLRAQGRFPTNAEDDWRQSDVEGHWWVPSGRVFYSPTEGDLAAEQSFARQHFFLPHRFRDPFVANVIVTYDDPHLLLPVKTQDAIGNTIGVEKVNYRTLQPEIVADTNGNRTRVAFDALGLVVGTAVMGKAPPAEVEGDTLNGFRPDLTQAEVDGILDGDDPRQPALSLLQDATTRIFYDVDRFQRTRGETDDARLWKPAYVATVARERHVGDLAGATLTFDQLQINFSYFDGFGREIQKKIQAEPGPMEKGGPVVSPRWVGSGWTVFNNKGKPARQYEPFFSRLPEKRHHFEFGVKAGVSSVVFYDPPGRVVATLHPNNTFTKVVFDPWKQTSYDANDTAAPFDEEADEAHQTGDPRTDHDIFGYVTRYFASIDDPQGWQTWLQQRITGAMGPQEKRAAEKTTLHANTPTIAYFDTLGRTFLTIAHNGFDEHAEPVLYPTRVELDIEGNQREVRDAVVQQNDKKGRLIARYHYDMLGNRIHQASMEAGERWLLNDITGKAIRTWDSRKHTFTTAYDPLRRPLRTTVTGIAGTYPDQPTLVERLVYGEQYPNASDHNLRGKLYLHGDQSGVTTTEEFDFKGNARRATRRLAKHYKETVDWRGVDAALPASASTLFDATALKDQIDRLCETKTFVSATRFDALNRPIQMISPHIDQPNERRNVIQPVYNEANLLEGLNVWLGQTAEPAALLNPAITQPSKAGVENIDYDAKGQRQRIDYQNGASTFYRYDEKTFRLVHLYTRRGSDFNADCGGEIWPPERLFAAPNPPLKGVSCGLQNFQYTYDPVGNITFIRDVAQQTIYFRHRRVEPSSDYTYDPLYRLIEATGREHLGQLDDTQIAFPSSYNDAPRVQLLHPGDGNAMGPYVETYVYDEVGNFKEIKHSSRVHGVAGWTRNYAYHEASQLELGKTSNRLTNSTVSGSPTELFGGTEGYDEHGNMLKMPQLTILQRDFRDQLQMTQRQAVNPSDTEGLGHQGERTWYVYDSSGQRVRKVTEKANATQGGDPIKEERTYLGGLEIYRHHGADSLVRETLHIMDNTRRIAIVETRINGPIEELLRVQFGNHLGTACLELDATAMVISYEEYSPYGSTVYQGVTPQVKSAKRYRYIGNERDEESGFNYHGARYYAPWLCRWISCDPLGFVDGTNVYAYSRNGPVGFKDSTGTQTDAKFEPPQIELTKGEHIAMYNGHKVDYTFYPGTSKEYVLIVGGVHRNELSARQLAKELKTELDAQKSHYYNILLIPDLFGGRGGTGRTVKGVETNRDFPASGLDLNGAIQSGTNTPINALGKEILPENVILIAAFEKLKASGLERTLSIHAHSVVTDPEEIKIKGAASITTDARVGGTAEEAQRFRATDEGLARLMANATGLSNERLPGNLRGTSGERYTYPTGTAPVSKAAKAGVTFGRYGSERGANQILIEVLGDQVKGTSADRAGFIKAINEIFLASPTELLLRQLGSVAEEQARQLRSTFRLILGK